MFFSIEKIARMKDEEGAQALVFTALLIFVLVGFFLVTINIGKTVYWRIRMQNAVDASALAAGLWQSRGLNLTQQLNNLHWDVNAMAAYAIWACILAIPKTKGASKKGIEPIENARNVLATLIKATRGGVVEVFPWIAYLHASEIARKNEADRVINAIGEFSSNLSMQVFGIPFPPDFIPFPLDFDVPLYAFGIRPTDLYLSPADLGVRKREDRRFPHHMPWWWFWPFAKGWGPEQVHLGGQPSPMTWVVGKESQEGFLGMGHLFASNGEGLEIPAMIAVASVQSKGSRVTRGGGGFGMLPFIGKPPSDYDVYLVPVTLPFGLPGKYMLFLH